MFDTTPKTTPKPALSAQLSAIIAALKSTHTFDPADELGLQIFGLMLSGYAFGYTKMLGAADSDNTARRDLAAVFTTLGISASYADGLIDAAEATLSHPEDTPIAALVGAGYALMAQTSAETAQAIAAQIAQYRPN